MHPDILDDRPALLRRLLFAAVFVGLLFATLWGRRPDPASSPDVWVFSGATMGTEYHVRIVPETGARAKPGSAAQAVADALEAVNRAMSTYRSDSELSRFNQLQEVDRPFVASPALLWVMQEAQRVSVWSGGAFDITVGPLVNAFGFGPDVRQKFPTDAELEPLRARVGFRMLEVDSVAGTLKKSRPDLTCDLSAIAKGYGVDQAAEALDRLGLHRYMVEVGGEVRARGRNERGEPWRIAIEKPSDSAPLVQEVVGLLDRSMATSGDYRNYYEVDGERISHTIDPRIGRPIRHRLASISVVHESCMTADALATALNVLGEEEGLALATREHLPALFMVRTLEGGFVLRATPAWEELRAQGGSASP